MEYVWWNQVTNAVHFISDIKNCLLEEKSVLLKYSYTIPWYDLFVDILKEGVAEQNAEKKFVDIPIVKEPGEYLLSEFCKKEKRAEYRPAKGYSKFFAEAEDIVLHDRYLWIRVDTKECLEKWQDFISEYIKERGKNKNKAVFLLEWSEKKPVPLKKGIRVLSFDDYLGEYDRIVFAVLASSDIKENVFIKNYIAELVSNISGNDIELSAECIKGYKDFLEDPSHFIEEVINNKTRSDGTAYHYENDVDTIQHLIWLSQIKTVYPRLEEFREAFVEKYANAIANNLPIQTSYGETYDDPKDVELGTLMYMVGNRNLSLNSSEYENLKNHKEARNKLSHLTALSIAEIRKLI